MTTDRSVRIQKLFALTADSGGCMHYRLALPWSVLEKRGLLEWARINADTVEERHARMSAADVLVFQSPASEAMLRYAEAKKELDYPQTLVVEHDDNPFAVSPFNPAYVKFGTEEVFAEDDGTGQSRFLWKDGEAGFDIERNKRVLGRFSEIVRLADLVTTPVKPLAGLFAGIGARAVVVLPNCLDFSLWKPTAIPHEGVRMGWHGGFSHYEDLLLLKDALGSLPEFVTPVVTGWCPPVLPKICPRIEAHGWVHIEAHPYKQMLAGTDFAVIPLVDNEFNRHKSPIKWAEYAALGVPVIASNVPPYSDVIDDGETGMLVEPDEWPGAIEAMARMEPARKLEMGMKAREAAKERFDIESRADEWLIAYQEAKSVETIALA